MDTIIHRYSIKKYRFLFFIILFSIIIPTKAQKVNEIGQNKWIFVNAEVVEHLGRKSIKGIAYLKDVEFENGTIEVDIAYVGGMKSYPGILFRMKDIQNYERVYLRPHRSIYYNDAIQYVASFNGIDSWQLYSGDGKTSSAIIPTDTWNHLKIEVSGSQAKVYLNDMTKPILHITDLAHQVSKGMIGIHGPLDGSAYFSNFTYTSEDDLNFIEKHEVEEVFGIIKDWEISQPLSMLTTDFQKYPAKETRDMVKWKKVESDLRGLVDISKYYPRTHRVGDCVLAKTILTAERDTNIILGFGYSDYITIFFNGVPVFFGNSAYQSRDNSFLGIVGYYDNVFLPLKKGKNELMILVGELSGGWGFMFRDENAMFLDEKVSIKWQIQNVVSSPESIVYDEKNDVCYVSSYFNEGKEYISKLSTDGKIIESEWISGLSMPSGMCIYNNDLYVVDRKNLNIIDTDSGIIKDRIPLTGVVFPNDVVVDGKGTFYISDSRNNFIFSYKNGVLEKWVSNEEINNPNGLLIDGNYLLVGVGSDATLKKINVSDKSIMSITKLGNGANIDGIKKYKDSGYIVSDYNGRLFLIQDDGQKELLINSKTPGITLADFEYIPSKNRIIIPTLFSNKIFSYVIN